MSSYLGVAEIQMRDARGNWSVIATQGASALAVDAAGNLYATSDPVAGGAIQKRDTEGHWSILATEGTDPGQVEDASALAVDTAGDLFVAEYGGRIQKRDAQGHWSVLDTAGVAAGQVDFSNGVALAVDSAVNLYVVDRGNNRVLRYAPDP